MGLFDFLFGSDDEDEEAAWNGDESGKSSPQSNSNTSGNVPDEDD